MTADNNESPENNGTRDGPSEKSYTSRRRFLAATGSLGVAGVAGVGNAGAVTIKKRVPKYIRGHDEVVEWMKVPESWLAQDELARTALETLNETFLGQKGVIETGLVRSEKTFGGKHGFDIEVAVNEALPLPDLPDSISGVDVLVREADPSEWVHQACKNIGDYSNYKGGVNISDDPPSSSVRSFGTAGYRAEIGGAERMVTAMHTFGDCSWTIGDKTYQDNDQIGTIRDGDVRADFVVTTASASGVSITNKIREPNGTVRTISGFASESEISNRVSNPFDGYSKVGISTGKKTGGLGKKDITVSGNCNDLRGEGVRGSADGAAGDSGGPYYSVESGDAYILAHHVYGTGGDAGYNVNCFGSRDVTNKTIGMPAYWVNNEGYSIG
jgi:hypothetical protein